MTARGVVAALCFAASLGFALLLHSRDESATDVERAIGAITTGPLRDVRAARCNGPRLPRSAGVHDGTGYYACAVRVGPTGAPVRVEVPTTSRLTIPGESQRLAARMPTPVPAPWRPRPSPRPSTRRMAVLVLEESCAGNGTAAGRVLPPTIREHADRVEVAYATIPHATFQNCPGHPATAALLTLPHPLGHRRLLDASRHPAREVQPIGHCPLGISELGCNPIIVADDQ